MKNLTDFRKTVETGVDPRLLDTPNSTQTIRFPLLSSLDKQRTTLTDITILRDSKTRARTSSVDCVAKVSKPSMILGRNGASI